MDNTKEKKQTVPFDPGFAPYVMAFSPSYTCLNNEVKKFKNASQRKMKYKSYELGILKLCDNLISFYFGGMLYGAYLKYKYKETPLNIEGNDFLTMSIDECFNGPVTQEVQMVNKFIKNNDRNPFATRKINPRYFFIIDSYSEFLEKNKYFTNTKTTADIKIPTGLSYISRYSEKKLDELYETIMNSISSKKIELLLTSPYFEKIKVSV